MVVILVLLTFFKAIAEGETRYIFHSTLVSKVRLENTFCEKSGALPRTVILPCLTKPTLEFDCFKRFL